MNHTIPDKIKHQIFLRDNYTCQKCNFHDLRGDDLEIHYINSEAGEKENNIYNPEHLITLCSICHKYAPQNKKKFKKYLQEKIDWQILNTFRQAQHSISKNTKKGMIERHYKGFHLTKAPRGYKLVDKKLVPDPEHAEEVKQIFEEFLNTPISLTQLAKKHNMTTTGIKKLLKNKTYIGKIKFDNNESQGSHQPIIPAELFNRVQEKLK
ncbi:MAG: recombinase family protein [Candidatus Nanoarchaeia archaeon]